MFNNINFLLLEGENKFIDICQNSAIAEWVRSCPMYKYINEIILGALVALLLSASFSGTGTLGLLTIVFILLVLLKTLTSKGERIEFSILDCAVLIYFLFA